MTNRLLRFIQPDWIRRCHDAVDALHDDLPGFTTFTVPCDRYPDDKIQMGVILDSHPMEPGNLRSDVAAELRSMAALLTETAERLVEGGGV